MRNNRKLDRSRIQSASRSGSTDATAASEAGMDRDSPGFIG